MIYTVTFNPAIDYVMKTNDIKAGQTNRSEYEKLYFGGKGINVSYILSQLDINSTALGFIAGFTGDKLKCEVEKHGIKTDFVQLKNGFTRINVKLKSDLETEINAQGPKIENDEVEALFEKLDKLDCEDTLVLAGSIPSSLPSNVYEQIIKRLQHKNIRVVVDATKDLLTNTLKFKPFLIKPNKQELQEIFGKVFKSDDEIIKAGFDLQERGAKNVLISLSEDGAILIDENKKVHKSKSLIKDAKNTVGAGDSMVAGFLAGVEKGYDYAFKLSLAAAGATAKSDNLALKEEILSLI
ncbi:MAG: 1-phosphofructokinase [Clostridia bacterium]|nr:1-phosphofructokinase [Clostridia bacterium]